MSDVFYTSTRPAYFQVTNAQFYMDDWKPKLTSPCCDNSCEVRVASAQLLLAYTGASTYSYNDCRLGWIHLVSIALCI